MVLRISCDCAGIEAPIQALKKLKIPFKHVWSADIDQKCIKQIKANFKPQRIYGDPSGPYKDGNITRRDNSKLPDIDLYMCGFPCQPFSSMGEKQGLKDKRGNVFYACLDVIKRKQPRMFVLENVKGLLTNDKGRTWKVIWGELSKLQKLGYNVDWKVLNTKDYGLPQSRPRVYIVGLKKKVVVWPNKCPMKNIKSFVDHSDTTKDSTTPLREKYIATQPKNTFIDLCNSSWGILNNPIYAPCVLSTGYMWCVPLHRYANVKELSALQGIKIKNVVNKSAYKHQIGNSMSVNTLVKLFKCNL